MQNMRLHPVERLAQRFMRYRKILLRWERWTFLKSELFLLGETQNGDDRVCMSDGTRLYAEYARGAGADNPINVAIKYVVRVIVYILLRRELFVIFFLNDVAVVCVPIWTFIDRLWYSYIPFHIYLHSFFYRTILTLIAIVHSFFFFVSLLCHLLTHTHVYV